MLLKSVFVSAAVVIVAALVEGGVLELSQVDQVRDAAVASIHELWSEVIRPDWLYHARKHAGGTDAQLMATFRHICDPYASIEPPTAALPEEVLSSLWNWAILRVEARTVEGLYDNFRRFQDRDELDPVIYGAAWQDLAENVLQDSPSTISIPKAMGNLHTLIADDAHKSIYQLALQILSPEDGDHQLISLKDAFFLGHIPEAKNSLCSVHQSPQQLLYNLYASIQLTQLKGYTMMQFSWMLLRLYGKGNFTLEAEMMRERYLERMLQQADAIKEAMGAADQSMWRCDPRDHVEGETYTQLTRLLQGYVQNEVDMNAQQSCKESCGYYSYAKQHGCFKNNFCARQTSCGGDIVDCRYIDSDMYICQADPMSNRRYEWIEYENGRVLGVQSQCARGKTKVDSWWRWLFWHCSFCFCLCDDSHQSDRYFNLRPTVSDIANNRVVTGVQFVKHNRVIHIKIQEAELLPKGAINESTMSWQPADNYHVTDNHVRSGADFHKMSWGERAIDLDDLIAPTNHIITGVRFRKVGTHLNMEIRATPFNFTTGELLKPHDKSLWLSNDNTDGALVTPRTLLELESPDVPTRTPIPSKPDSHSDQYLLFTYSDIDLDAAQTTVPFVDTQPVAPQPSTPLAGLGLHHKGQRWFGGFVALKVFTYDFGRHIRDNFPQINEAIQIKK